MPRESITILQPLPKSEAKGSSLDLLVSPLACPFCGVEAKEHDGDYVLGHTNECFFTQHYAQEMWLVGKRKVRIWNKRANAPASATPNPDDNHETC